MADLTDYLDLDTLRRLQDAFSAVAKAPVSIRRPDGAAYVDPPCAAAADEPARVQGPPVALAVATCPDRPLTLAVPVEDPADALDVPVVVGSEVVGRVRPGRAAKDGAGESAAAELLALVANILTCLCEQQRTLRNRAQELTTLYLLTGEFTSRRDVQSVLSLVTETVVKVLGAKACSIRLLDETHTHLLRRAIHNLSQAYLDKGPVMVADSIVDQQALATLEPVYVGDLRTDPRVLYPAEANAEGLVSALCAPMVYHGQAEGVIRVYTGEPYEFDFFEVNLLKAISAQAAAAIVNARLGEEAVHAANMRRVLSLAGEIQRRMVPQNPPGVPGVEFGAVYVPCYALGGDFYDYIDLPPRNHGVAICDVAGKGVRASLLMASLRASLRAHASNVYSMPDVLAKVNRDFCGCTLSHDFATLFYAVLDDRTRRLSYVNAGHPPPALFRNGQTRRLDTGGSVLGVDPAFQWEFDSFILQPGDVVLAYTDGLVEARDFHDSQFGRDRAEAAAREAIRQGRSAPSMAQHVLWAMRRFAGLSDRPDDVTILVIKVT